LGFDKGKNGNLVWCNEDGNEWSDDKEMKKARRSGIAYVRVSRLNNLPTPYQLTGDPQWDVDGEFNAQRTAMQQKLAILQQVKIFVAGHFGSS